MDERHAHGRQAERPARDRAADELHHHPGSHDTLTPRIALPLAISPDVLVGHDPQASVRALAGKTMGTTWRVLAAAPREADDTPLQLAIEQRLAGLIAQMSHWDPASLLSRFNAAPAGRWFALPPDFAAVIDASLRMAERSGGAFDPAIGRIVDLWGFGPSGPMAPPDRQTVMQAAQAAGWRRLAWDAEQRRLRQPGGLSLDLSGIAKGYAVDCVAALTAEHGIAHTLVEIGGELAGRGMRPDGEPWWVDLEDPFAAAPPIRIALHGLAVATSGDYRRGAHSVDPRTARPCTNGVGSVSVIAATAMEADALATALTVLGTADGMALATRLDVAARFLVRGEQGMTELLSPALQRMIEG